MYMLKGSGTGGARGALPPPILDLHTQTLRADNRLLCSLLRQPPQIIFPFHHHCTCSKYFITCLFVSRCGSGLEGLRQQGYTNPVVFRMVQHYETLFEVRIH